ncbi:MAG: divalent metal cation transporter [Chitinophagales bacterium]|nr:divalent metal cation transporter [Chitinophagales bacterium]
MQSNSKSKKFLQTLGPGILFASTAIGVSHLIQSTKAGASYGFSLMAFIIAANIFKFPFFEFGTRYAAATGTSLIDGYHKMNKYVFYLYLLITLCSMFFVSAAVCFVAAGFFENLFHLSFSSKYFYLSSLILISICFVILASGQYKTLDGLIKVVAIVLLLCTLIAFMMSVFRGPGEVNTNFFDYSLIQKSSLPFIIALMGWMPTAVDLSTWNSLWTIERIKQSGYTPSLKESLFEFHLGYWISAVLALCFLSLGAYLVFSTGKMMPDGNVPFAAEVIHLFTQNFGKWSYYIIALAAFAIMFSTSIGVLDGYARALNRSLSILGKAPSKERISYSLFLFFTCLGALAVIIFFNNNFAALVNFATILSFLIAPIIAVLNYKLVISSDLSKAQQPGTFMKIWTYLGIILLSAFSIFYLYTLIAN